LRLISSYRCTVAADDLVVFSQSLVERAKGQSGLLKDATEKEQQILDIE
jgi:hypothetical protein